jgi:hypothetical protein
MGKHMCGSSTNERFFHGLPQVGCESAVQSKLAAGASGTEYFTTAPEGQLA